MAFHYKVYGEHLASEIELGVLEPSEPAAGAWTVRVSSVAVPGNVAWYHTIAGDDEDGMLRYGEADGFHYMEISGFPTVRISTVAREIVAMARGPVSSETLTHVVVDQALPLSIAHSRRIVLHASCVARGELAMAFAGPSGSGKSTLAAAFCRRGWQLVSDDALAFASLSPPRVDVAYPSVRLWRASLRSMGAHDLELPRVAADRDKRLLSMPHTSEPPLLRRIYLVKPGESGLPHTIRQPSLSETIMGISASSFRLDTRDRARLAFEFDALSRLSQACRTSILEVARGFDKMEELVDMIEADFGAG